MFIAKKAKSDLSSSAVRFVDCRREGTSRYKHLRLHIDQHCKDDEDRQVFIELHMSEMFQLFLDLLVQSELFLCPVPARLGLADLESALWLLEEILHKLPEHISIGWQYSAIESSLKLLLNPDTLTGLRRVGVRLFLCWYQCLSQGPRGVSDLDLWFASLVPVANSAPFQNVCEYPGSRWLSLSPAPTEDQPQVCFKRAYHPVAHNRRGMNKGLIVQSFTEKLLEFICNDCTKIMWEKKSRLAKQKACLKFLIDKTYEHYAAPGCPRVVVYNVEAITASLSLDPFCEHGLASACDDEDDVSELRKICVHVVIRWIALYALSYHKRGWPSATSDESVNEDDVSFAESGRQSSSTTTLSSPLLTKAPVNHALVNETILADDQLYSTTLALLREAFFLPLNYVGTVARAFRVLREWLLNEVGQDNWAPPTRHDVKTVIAILVSFFDNDHLQCAKDTAQPTEPLVTQICVRILNLLKQVACSTGAVKMTTDTWHFLLKALLHVVHRSVPESRGRPLPAPVVPQVFQTLLVTWVFAGLNVSLSSQLWDELLATCSRRTAWSQLLLEWSKVMESITRALGLELYNVDVMDPPPSTMERQKLKKKQTVAGQRPVSHGLGNVDERYVSPDVSGGENVNFTSALQSSFAATAGPVASVVKQAERAPTDEAQSCLSKSSVEALGEEGKSGGHQSKSSSDDSDSYDSVSEQLCSNEGRLFLCSVDEAKSTLLGDDLVEAMMIGQGDAGDELVCCQEAEIVEETRMAIAKSKMGAESTPEPLSVVWRRMLCCLGDLSQIGDREIHVHAVQVVRVVINLLMKIRGSQAASPDLVPPLGLFLPWLSDTLHLDQSYSTSRLIAARLYCLVMTERDSLLLSDVQVADFFTFASSLAWQEDDALANAFVVSCSPRLFGHFWPCSLLVLPELLTAASRIIACRSRGEANAVDRVNVVRFVSAVSLLTVERPNFATYHRPLKVVESGCLQLELFQCLLNAVDAGDCGASSIALRGLSLLMHSALKSGRLNGLVQGCFETILKRLLLADSSVSLRAIVCQVFSSLLVFNAHLSENHFSLVRQLFTAYATAAHQLLTNGQCQQSGGAVELLERICCDLVEWILLIPALVVDRFNDQEPAPLLSLLRILQAMLEKPCKALRAKAVGLYAVLNAFFDQRRRQRPAVGQSTQHQPFSVGFLSTGTLMGKVGDGRASALCSRTVVGRHVWKVRSLMEPRRCPSAADEWLKAGRRSGDGALNLHATNLAESQLDDDCPFNSLVDRLFDECKECATSCQMEDEEEEEDQHALGKCDCGKVRASHTLNGHPAAPDQAIVDAARPAAVPCNFDQVFCNNIWALNCLHRLGDVVLLERSEQAERHCRHIDNTPCTELHKIAVIYVAAGQEDKQSILKNSQGSGRFEQFVAGLGWQVDLRSHAGYAGGLPADGGSSPYYCTPLLEAVFHVSTRLPGENVANKLRHIGNDEVHIVWSEHWRDYRRSTIPTEFCDVLIAIYPLGDELYRVQIECDHADMAEFGPLFNDAIVHWSILACLVRCTAINANRLKRRSIEGYKSAHQLRWHCMSEMMDYFRKSTSLSHLLARIIHLTAGRV